MIYCNIFFSDSVRSSVVIDGKSQRSDDCSDVDVYSSNSSINSNIINVNVELQRKNDIIKKLEAEVQRLTQEIERSKTIFNIQVYTITEIIFLLC